MSPFADRRAQPSPALGDRRGIAVPTAVLSLLLLSTVVVSFSTLSAIEPTIANNQLRVAQARAIAEAGVEQALWALSNPDEPNGIPAGVTTAAAPYDGSHAFPVAVGPHELGSFRVTVASGTAPYERLITAVGYAPGEGAPRAAVQRITATAINARLIPKDPPAAVWVGGELRAEGTLHVDARADTACGRKVGTASSGQTRLGSAIAEIHGAADGNAIPNQVTDAGGGPVPAVVGDVVTGVSRAALDAFGLTDADLAALRAIAIARGTYVKGSVRFDAGRPLPDGLVFVEADTPGGSASVQVDGAATTGSGGGWSGWLIVDGSLSIAGEARMRGLVYARDALAVQGAGASLLAGAVVGQYARVGPDGVAEASIGDISIAYHCEDARTGAGTVPGRWTIKRGSYREASS